MIGRFANLILATAFNKHNFIRHRISQHMPWQSSAEEGKVETFFSASRCGEAVTWPI